MKTLQKQSKLQKYLKKFDEPQRPQPTSFYLVDWGECENIQGARYALIEGSSMWDALINLDGAIHDDDNVKLKPLNSEKDSMSHCYLELCDLENRYNIPNNLLNNPHKEKDLDTQAEWVKAKDFYALSESEQNKL
jgi:hypothetical protein